MKVSSLFNIVLFFTFFPFLNLLPFLSFETSPFAGVMAFIILLVTLSKNSFKGNNLYILFFLLLSIFLYRFDHIFDAQYNGFYIKTVLGLLLGFFVFSATTANFHRMKFKTIYNFIIIWFIVGILQISPLNDFINVILDKILTRSASGDIESDRGIQLLANEPSFAGIYLVLFLVLLDLFHIKQQVSLNKLWVMRIFIFILLIQVKSANGFLLFMTYIFFKALKKDNKKIFLYTLLIFSAILPVAYFIITNYEFNSRGLKLLQLLLLNPGDLLNDQSLSSRFDFIYLSYFGAVNNYFVPIGVGSYSFNWMTLVNELNINSYEVIRSSGKYLMPMSFLGGISHDYGIFGITLFLVLIFLPMYKARRGIYRNYIFYTSLLILSLWLQTCSYALPLPWLILGINYSLIKKTNLEQLHAS